MVTRTAPEPMTDFTPLEAGVYVGEIKSISEVEKQPDMYHENPYSQFEFLWEIEDEDREEPFTIKSWFSISVNEKSNLSTKLFPAIGVAPILPGAQWDEDEWIGMSCQLQLEKYTNAAGYERNKIVSYMALPKRKSGRQPF